MNVTALSKKERKYTPEELKGQANAPVFTLTSVSRLEYLEIMSNSDVDMPAEIISDGNVDTDAIAKKLASGSMGRLYSISISTIKSNITILTLALKGWENIKDEVGDVFEFSPGNIELLPDDLMDDLVREVTGTLNEVTEKNSGKESPSSSGSEKKTSQESGIVTTVEEKSSSEQETAEEATVQPQ